MLFSWLRRVSSDSARHGRRPSVMSGRFRPRLEGLEGRDVPSTLHVTSPQDDGSPGTLRAEIAAAHSGDTIVFDFDPSLGGQTITLAQGELQITKNLTIQGPGATQLTISGGGTYGSRAFEIDGASTTVSLSGLSLTRGNGTFANPYIPDGIGWSGGQSGGTGTASDGQGGTIWNGGVLTISNCILSSNSADLLSPGGPPRCEGGAIYNAGTLTVSNSTLSSNAAGDPYGEYSGDGGAIYNAGKLTVTGSSLSDNAAQDGGGAIFNLGTLAVSGGTISDNSAFSGGAICSDYKTTTTVTGTTMSGNTAYWGGAIWNDGTMTLSGCSVDANSASSLGGGIVNYRDAHLTIQAGSRVTGNSAGTAGADLYNYGGLKISRDSTVGVIGP